VFEDADSPITLFWTTFINF